MNFVERIRGLFRIKALTIVEDGFIPHEVIQRSDHLLGRSHEGLDSNVIMAPVLWIMRTFTEAQARVQRRTETVWDWVEDHAAETLIDRPNEAYDGDALWKGTALSYTLNGNAYWLKVRNVFGDVIRLWYIPHWLITPRYPSDGSTFISHYDYSPGFGPVQRLLPRDVVHFRFGLDPSNPRLGYSPIRPLLREIFTDDEAARFSARILENMGVPGVIISPKDGMPVSPEEAQKLKDYINANFTGEGRGGTLVFGRPTEMAQFGFDPQKLLLGDIRDITEERVCAVLGLPSAVVGFGSGLQSTKVGATMRELRRLAWVQCLIPMQKSLAKQLTAQLLPDFVAQARRFRVRFDTSDVSAFQEEDDLRAKRAAILVQAGILRVDRGQEMAGVEVDTNAKHYLVPANSLMFDEHGDPMPMHVPGEEPNAGLPAEAGDDMGIDAMPDEGDRKALRAIASRYGFGNGNGHHTEGNA